MQPSPGHFSSKTTIAVLIFVLGCLVSSARLVVEAPQGHIPDEVARRSDLRFAQIKAALPARGVVGYIGAPADSIDCYYLAQYALAPLVVDRSPNHPLIVGNFPSSPSQVPANLEVLRDFGGGVLLLANKDQN
jgi:hypothetical protein